MPANDLPLLTFVDAAAFERWLEEYGESEPGAWLRFAKQGAPETTVSKARQSEAAPDADLLAALDAEPAARGFFDALDAANRFAVLYRIHQTKTPEKRRAKIAELVTMLSGGETIHPRRSKRGGSGKSP